MKFFFVFYLIFGIIFSQSKIFSVSNGNAKEIIYSSSFWLSGSPAVDPAMKNRMIFQSGISSVFKNKNMLQYPNFTIGLKLSKNLLITYNAFGFQSGDESPQILGGGIQWYYGGIDTLNWSTSFQRNDLKGLKNFSLTSLKIDVQKWSLWRNYRIRFGFGSNFFKQSSISENSEFPNSLEGQINYLCFGMKTPISVFHLGLDSQVSMKHSMVTIFLQKPFF